MKFFDPNKNCLILIFWGREVTDVYCVDNGNGTRMRTHRKKSHTLKYSKFSSNLPRDEQLGILKSMLHRAYNLCDEAEGQKDAEVKFCF